MQYYSLTQPLVTKRVLGHLCCEVFFHIYLVCYPFPLSFTYGVLPFGAELQLVTLQKKPNTKHNQPTNIRNEIKYHIDCK